MIENDQLWCEQVTATWRWFEVRPSAAWFAAGFGGLLVLIVLQLLRYRLVVRRRPVLEGREGRIDGHGWVALEGEESPMLIDDESAALPAGPIVVVAGTGTTTPYRAGQLPHGSTLLSGTKADISAALDREMLQYDNMSIPCLIVPVCPVVYPLLASGLLS